ncbi:actin binding protein family protein [Entamoeba histolytica HM-1:IMSS-B]|uniref:Twinfilin n=5 Tax=Entamoeba histolytica TaxID=5759 RepID=C4LVP4_ENTH1|nr:actin-binding protein, cofilin/tropomyosin family [Entamoeba histolytica HM-1:IMSS]EMD46768.1 actinbinding protein cofilin/tropomyosin family protein [Entamoeba histolytica KU27]EMH78073.1 actin binding protein family protein [Entamoeba histolytica HM-1:IMSS-B]ENY63326.1 actin-binding protein, cofilin/tropomyosin family protein, putative [Entamoeba histolytica HM-1:IMSS-A]GAT92747.1 actin-binding protein cofilin tropomyosin family [Entamoeba histolytica]EAL51058.1 actin-binding protein, cof|eukprot:XP_656444.1 actin-binding protein, cofilin/tropomyosin family [Entamoeba histolytica HM-1:IMSS]
MSHSSGIELSTDLINKFKDMNSSGNGRFIQATIVDETINIKAIEQGTSDFDADLDLVLKYLVEGEPSYILFRTETRDDITNGYKWLLLAYIPDRAKVRMKMLYSSTKARFRTTLGGSTFLYEIHGTVFSDFGKSGYEAFLRHEMSAPPLTEEEEEREKEIELGVSGLGAVPTGMATVTASNGVAFPVDEEVINAVKELCDGGNNYVQIGIDIDSERIVLQAQKSVEIDHLGEEVPLTLPAFHFYRWDHEYEGQQMSKIIYIFSCPDGSGNTKSAPVKQRMLYSTSKGAVESVLTGNGKEVDLKLEINAPKDLSVNDIQDKIHPPPVQEKKMFARPKPKFCRKK